MLNITQLTQNILQGNRVALARGITLIESNKPDHFETAQKVLERLLPHSGNAVRIGISGAPGAGKSTFIEALGLHLIDRGHRVAVLAIDPSSQRSGGSILGDKTRMEQLARREEAFIRPSASGGALGGVARKTRESIILCEAAGYDVVLVETMGVGQGEYAVRSMVDVFLLLQIAGAGDTLQGIKRGIMEIADIFIINKADGENKTRAETARSELNMALRYMPNDLPDWKPPVLTASALEKKGIQSVWQHINNYLQQVEKHIGLKERRKQQDIQWMYDVLDQEIRRLLYTKPDIKHKIRENETAIRAGHISPAHAAAQILKFIRKVFKEDAV